MEAWIQCTTCINSKKKKKSAKNETQNQKRQHSFSQVQEVDCFLCACTEIKFQLTFLFLFSWMCVIIKHFARIVSPPPPPPPFWVRMYTWQGQMKSQYSLYSYVNYCIYQTINFGVQYWPLPHQSCSHCHSESNQSIQHILFLSFTTATGFIFYFL